MNPRLPHLVCITITGLFLLACGFILTLKSESKMIRGKVTNSVPAPKAKIILEEEPDSIVNVTVPKPNFIIVDSSTK